MTTPEYLNHLGMPKPDKWATDPHTVSARQWNAHPVVFHLKKEWLEPLRHVDVRLKAEEYQQPYPSIIVQWPDGGPFVLASVIQTQIAGRMLVLTHSTGVRWHGPGRSSRLGNFVNLSNRGVLPDGTHPQYIEQSLAATYRGMFHTSDSDVPLITDTESATVHDLARVAVNACLLLASHPHYRKRSDLERKVKLLRKHGTRKAYLATRDRQRLMPQVIEFSTDPELYDNYGTPTGRHVRAHWRRGHFKMQPYGPAWSLRRVIFVKAVLVHRAEAESEANEISYVGQGGLAQP